MTGRNQGAVCSREPDVPAPVARFASLVTKAELVELLWTASGLAPNTGLHERLVTLVQCVNVMRWAKDAGRGPLDASRLTGPGVIELRKACGEACRLDAEAEHQEPN